MALQHDPKALADSLELDYHDRPRRLQRWQWHLTWICPVAAVVFVLAILLSPGGRTALHAGPVAAPHLMFNQDCSKCHTAAFATAGRFAPGTYCTSTPDASCTQCHAGPDHNDSVKADHCAGCHTEHRGHTLLARPGDAHCTDCHSRLQEKYPRQGQYENVASFAAHPEFKLWRATNAVDPGTVTFNHKKHLELEIDKRPGADPAAVHELQTKQCAACHQPDAAGRYMEPIQFEKHCQKCHALQLAVTVEPEPAELKLALYKFHQKPTPHPHQNQSAWDVRAAVRERYLQFGQGHAGLLALQVVPVEDWKLPPGLPPRGEPATQSQLDWVTAQWHTAEALLFNKKGDGCARCHTEISTLAARIDALPDYGKPQIPPRWFAHANFDHKAHRMVTCSSCHEGAETSTKRDDVLMPKLAHCQACHQQKAGFARADCVECHHFHKRDAANPWQGKMTIPECTGR
jgi:hypothetical protein